MTIKHLQTPISEKEAYSLNVGDAVLIDGIIYTGRDAVMPKLVKCSRDCTLDKNLVNLSGSVIFHTAVSPAGIGPTSSNKYNIESNIPFLSQQGVKIHLGKGELSNFTVKELKRYNALYAITPPVSALLSSKIVSQRVIAFPEDGMEAMYELVVKDFPIIIAIAHGVSIFATEASEKNAEEK